MRKQHILRAAAAGLLALTLLAAVPPSAGALPELPPEPAFDGYLVKLDPNGPVTLSEEELTADGSMTPVIGGVYRTDDKALADELLDIGVAEHVERNYIVTLDQDAPLRPPVPEPMEYGWAYRWMKVDLAEKLGLDGTGVRIAIIDSGLEPDNPNLAGVNIAAWKDYVEPEATGLVDSYGHGTCVAQSIAGQGIAVNGSYAVRGVAPGAELVPLRCFGGGESGLDILMKAIDDAVRVYHCQIINMSWGVPHHPDAEDQRMLRELLDTVRAAGVVSVAASGNLNGGAQGTVFYPAGCDSVLGVGAVDCDGMPSDSFAIQSAAVDVVAPGSGMPYVLRGKVQPVEKWYGTSFACPCAAGTAALLLQLSPEMGPEDVFTALRERAISPEEGRTDRWGWGAVQIDALLNSTWLRCGEVGAAFSARGWIADPALDSLVTAVYGPEGRLENCTVSRGRDGLFPVSRKIGKGEGRLGLFFLDGVGAPTAPAQFLPEMIA